MNLNSRRKLLKSLGVAVPVAWTTPVVSSVLLPIHAQTSPLYPIGSTGPGGGIVFYLEPGTSGTKGLEAATADASSVAVQWGCLGTDIPDATGKAIGTGNQNTIAMLATCSGSPVAMAATSEGPGWFLPSKDELNAMYEQLYGNNLGGFTDGSIYWSSSQVSKEDEASTDERLKAAWTRVFTASGSLGKALKTDTYKVRAVRAF